MVFLCDARIFYGVICGLRLEPQILLIDYTIQYIYAIEHASASIEYAPKCEAIKHVEPLYEFNFKAYIALMTSSGSGSSSRASSIFDGVDKSNSNFSTSTIPLQVI